MNSRSYIIDTKTTNISFLQLAADLQKKGIKNNAFSLVLYDRSLQNISPHDPDLPSDIRDRIVIECIRNPWYYLREVSMIPDPGGRGVRYRINRATAALTFLALHGIDSYITIARQIGKTQSILALIAWAYRFGTTNTEMMLANKRQEDAITNLSRLKAQLELLPKFLNPSIGIDLVSMKDMKGVDNTKSIMDPNTNNRIVVKASATSVETADQIGRGNSQGVQHLDETEFTKHILTILKAAGPAYQTTAKNSERNNAFHARILSSTPGNLDSPMGAEGYEIVKGCRPWSEECYDWTKEQLTDYVNTGVGFPMFYIEYSYKQLGLDEQWFIDSCKSLGYSTYDIKRELLLYRMHGNSESPFSQEALEHISQTIVSPIKEEFLNKYFLIKFYEEIDPDRCYVISVDPSAGSGVDNSSITVTDPYTEEPVAVMKNPFISIKSLSALIVKLVLKYFRKPIIVIERNSIGAAVIELLLDSPVAQFLYYDRNKMIQETNEVNAGRGLLELTSTMRKYYGIYNDARTRPVIMDILIEIMNDYDKRKKIKAEYIIKDIMALVVKNDKIQANSGSHDDCILSYLLGLFVIRYGNNLERYGYAPQEAYVKDVVDPIEEYMNVLQAMEDANMSTDIFTNHGSEFGSNQNYVKLINDIRGNYNNQMSQPMSLVTDISELGDDEVLGLQNTSIDLDIFDELNKY